MPGKPLVTVLMPVYNGGRYLRSSIESILGQTFKDFELLIINDCSTDSSLETIRSFRDSRIIVHSNDVNMGQTKSLNVGLSHARGTYTVINDADDLSLPIRIATQLSYISAHPEYVVVGSSSYIMDRDDKIKRAFLKPVDPRQIRLMILSETPLIHGSVIMRTEAIKAHGGYNEDFRICQDNELWSSLMRAGHRVANIPDVLVVIRHYMDSTSFRERDAQTQENSKIISANVEALTKIKISHEEAIRQRRFFFATGSLDWSSFREAEKLFVKEYQALKDTTTFDSTFAVQHLKGRLMKPYSKMALSRLQDGCPGEARNICRIYLSNCGFHKIPFLIWLMTFTGKLSSRMLTLYECLQEMSAKIHGLNRLQSAFSLFGNNCSAHKD